jgi:regulator of replication initiation timing
MAKTNSVEEIDKTVNQHEQAISELTELLGQMLDSMKLGQVEQSPIRARIRSIQTLLKKLPPKSLLAR